MCAEIAKSQVTTLWKSKYQFLYLSFAIVEWHQALGMGYEIVETKETVSNIPIYLLSNVPSVA